jgi:hypothetical protein
MSNQSISSRAAGAAASFAVGIIACSSAPQGRTDDGSAMHSDPAVSESVSALSTPTIDAYVQGVNPALV